MTYRALIVDDEGPARANLRLMLAKDPGWSLVGEAANIEEAAALLNRQPVDLVFLDVQMPGGSGLDLARKLSDGRRSPTLIFVSAFQRHAVDAFDTTAVGYLLKPFSGERFFRALRRAQERIDLLRTEDADSGNELAAAPVYPEWFYVKSVRKVERIAVRDVRWIEACGNYVMLHLDDRDVMHRITIAKLEATLDAEEWQRVHRGSIVRRREICSLHSTGPNGWEIEIASGARVPVGPSYLDRVKLAFDT